MINCSVSGCANCQKFRSEFDLLNATFLCRRSEYCSVELFFQANNKFLVELFAGLLLLLSVTTVRVADFAIPRVAASSEETQLAVLLNDS